MRGKWLAAGIAALAICGATVGPTGVARASAPVRQRVRVRVRVRVRDSFGMVAPTGVALRDTFVTVTATPSGSVVQLRATTDGSVLRHLAFRQAGTVSATETPTGDLLVALSSSCSTTLDTVDPADGRTVATARLDESASMVTLSPGGQYLAYVTYGPCTQDRRLRPDAPAAFLPDVLAVRDLATGATVSLATQGPGQPWWSISWSPGGRHLLAGYQGGAQQQLMVVDPAHPVFSRAHRVPAPKGCGLLAGAWRASGIVAGLDCRADSPLSPEALVRVSPTGTILARSPLPRCIDGFVTQVDPGERATVVETDIGYGKCGAAHHNRISVTRGVRLRTVTDAGVDVALG